MKVDDDEEDEEEEEDGSESETESGSGSESDGDGAAVHEPARVKNVRVWRKPARDKCEWEGERVAWAGERRRPEGTDRHSPHTADTDLDLDEYLEAYPPCHTELVLSELYRLNFNERSSDKSIAKALNTLAAPAPAAVVCQTRRGKGGRVGGGRRGWGVARATGWVVGRATARLPPLSPPPPPPPPKLEVSRRR